MNLGPVLTLENFTFPLPPRDSIDFDMKRSIAKLDFPGGPPIYQDMGMDEKILEFSGSIVADNAIDLSGDLETLWWSGKELQFTYGDIKKRVRIENYRPKIRRDDRVDYSIRLLVCYPESELSNADSGTEIPMLVDNGSSPTIETVYDRDYVIKQGDTLWDLAARSDVFANGTKWELIAATNGITDEYSLQIGQTIKLPSPGNSSVAEDLQQQLYADAVGETGVSELQDIEEGVS